MQPRRRLNIHHNPTSVVIRQKLNRISFSPEKCDCVEVTLGSPKLFCAMEYDYGESRLTQAGRGHARTSITRMYRLSVEVSTGTHGLSSRGGGVESLCVLSPAVLLVRVMSAHDRGSHAEVEVKVRKVLHQTPRMKIKRGNVTLYPESWTVRGCTCPVLNPGEPQPTPARERSARSAVRRLRSDSVISRLDSRMDDLPALC